MAPTLCEYCAAIPLDLGLKIERGEEYDDSKVWPLGTFGRLRKSNCPFCELVTSTCAEVSGAWRPPGLPDDSAPIKITFNTGGFQVRGRHSTPGHFICLTGLGQRTDPIYDVALLKARASLDQWIDLEEVHRWILACEREHQLLGCCRDNTEIIRLKDENGQRMKLRLIDVHRMRIVEAEIPCRYVALSYVWGEPNSQRLVLNQSNKTSLMQEGALARLQHFIPNTILDAISVVRGLGEHFLWVDSLCLTQDDPSELESCVAIMDTFYALAIFTIIAGSGSNAYAGLPGIPPTPRTSARFVREVMPGVYMTTISDVYTWLRQSYWSRRAWTMQEEVLSNRLLVFVNDQVYFRCRDDTYSEAMNGRGRRLVNFGFSASVLTYVLQWDEEATFSHYSTLMMYYGTRKTTVASDVLRAAQGMLREYSRLSGKRVWEGLPIPLEQSLLFRCEWREAGHNPRRQGYPSYSWAGWEYPPRWSQDIESAVPAEDHNTTYELVPDPSRDLFKTTFGSRWTPTLWSWIQWHCMTKDGAILSFADETYLQKCSRPTAEQAKSKRRPSFQLLPVFPSNSDIPSATVYPLLLFWTVCIDLRLAKMPPSGDPEYRYQLKAIDKNGRKCGVVNVDLETEDELAEATFALITATERGYWALLLKFLDNGTAERRGVVELTQFVLEDSLPPGPRWQEIWLG